MKFASGGELHFKTHDGSDWQALGTVSGAEGIEIRDEVPVFLDNGYLMPTEVFTSKSPWWTVTEEGGIETRTMRLDRTYTYKVEFNVKKINRRTHELLFGVKPPRAARSLRRRRAKLKRKRRMRARR